MSVTLRRARLDRGRPTPGVDITVKSAKGEAKVFAPEWAWVLSHKNWAARLAGETRPYPKYGYMSDDEYTMAYFDRLAQVDAHHWRWLKEQAVDGVLTLLCFCPAGRFCHTHLLIDYMRERWPAHFTDGRKEGEG